MYRKRWILNARRGPIGVIRPASLVSDKTSEILTQDSRAEKRMAARDGRTTERVRESKIGRLIGFREHE